MKNIIIALLIGVSLLLHSGKKLFFENAQFIETEKTYTVWRPDEGSIFSIDKDLVAWIAMDVKNKTSPAHVDN